MSGEAHVVGFGAGCPIASAAQQLVEAAALHGAAEGTFNGILLKAGPHTAAIEIVAAFQIECENRARQYRLSPEGIAAAAAQEQTRADLQARHDALMRRLPSLDFRDQCAVLDWLCEMQAPSDHVGVIVRRKTILAAFAKHEFLPGVNCGADFRPEVRDNVHRWLVGQALDGLEGPAIHGIIHKFAADWKAKFLRSKAPAQ